MDNEVNEKKEKRLKIKQRIKLILRGFLVVLNCFLLCYLVASVSGSVVKYIRKFNEISPSTFIKLKDYSEKESLKIYKKNISYDVISGKFNVTETTNYSFYGGYLHFKDNNDVIDSNGSLYYSSYSQYVLKNLFSDELYSSELDFASANTSFNNGIYLYGLKEGSYIVYPYDYKSDTSKMNPLKISTKGGIYETIYSPLKNGKRTKIELRSNEISPCFVINVKEILYTPESYSDIAILCLDADKTLVDNVFNGSDYKINFINKVKKDKDNVINLYNAKAPISVIVDDGDSILTSNYLTLNCTTSPLLIEEGNLKGLDADVYIRELAGDVFNSGKGLSSNNNENLYLTKYIDGRNNGSYVIRIGKDKLDQLPMLLKNI